ncbi:MAG: hypothetical protein Q7K42_02235 [Candidatus Diapherotrites archaeon]|nr:hypothetical protein [Candidatus Diapherotrites archaeon]
MLEKVYKIIATEEFLKDYKNLPKDEQQRVDKAKEQLKTNPYSGKPLGYDFFREKKLGVKRLYYTIYENKIIVLVLAYGGKKDQQATINAIKTLFLQYKEEVEKL